MTGQIASQTEVTVTKDICSRAWLPLGYNSKKDTLKTVEGVKGGNRAREAFCQVDIKAQ